jgi:2'-5' RNA ligase
VDMGSDACRSIIKAFDSHFTGRSNKRIHPHVTVARVRNKKSYDRWKLSEVSRITSDLGCRIDTVVLFSSRLERSGAVYTPLHTIRL